MPGLSVQQASAEDVSELMGLRQAVAGHLTSEYGIGPWSDRVTAKGVLWAMRRSRVYLAYQGDKLVASFALQTQKPWSIDCSLYDPCKRPLYLTSMAVAPEEQRKGIGRECLRTALRIAKEWPADALRLDAFDAAAGAGDFYHKCGFREVGRGRYREVPHIYFEALP